MNGSGIPPKSGYNQLPNITTPNGISPQFTVDLCSDRGFKSLLARSWTLHLSHYFDDSFRLPDSFLHCSPPPLSA